MYPAFLIGSRVSGLFDRESYTWKYGSFALFSLPSYTSEVHVIFTPIPSVPQVDYIRNSRDIPVKRAQEAELCLLAGNVIDAEGILLQAGQSIIVRRRLIMIDSFMTVGTTFPTKPLLIYWVHMLAVSSLYFNSRFQASYSGPSC